ncbi:hypothetical protein V3C99_011599 [Haemonchus contortus]|uniref:Serpentine receptor class gamma n=1 Tax=Haemonchus contortus TaxID=6289 RepID=A0A7I4Y724_HAECO
MNVRLIIGLQHIYIVPSILLYLAEFFYIICSRDDEFSSAFYYIFLIRAPADMIQVTTSLITFRYPVAGWTAVLDKPYVAKIGFALTNFACNIELFTQLMLSINRLTAICYPMKHSRWWTLKRTIRLFACGATMSMITPVIRIFQDAGYVAVDGKIVPYLINENYQQLNSYISSAIYSSFCISCFSLNAAALFKHSQQRNVKIFDQQFAMARRLQLNLLVYSSAFTLAIISMTIFQCMLALNVFPLQTDAHALVIIMLTLSADSFALANPWLLLSLSSTFRTKFLKFKSSSSLPHSMHSVYTV